MANALKKLTVAAVIALFALSVVESSELQCTISITTTCVTKTPLPSSTCKVKLEYFICLRGNYCEVTDNAYITAVRGADFKKCSGISFVPGFLLPVGLFIMTRVVL